MATLVLPRVEPLPDPETPHRVLFSTALSNLSDRRYRLLLAIWLLSRLEA